MGWRADHRDLRKIAAGSGMAIILAAAAVLQADPAGDSDRVVLMNATTRIASSGVSHRAVRRLEAWSVRGDARGWLEAATEFDPASGLRYTVLRRGGTSDRIQNRVLPQILEAEQQAWASGEVKHGALSPRNYQFGEVDSLNPEVIGVRLHPLRRERMLVDGTAWIRRTGQLMRIQGQLAKSPSFWVSRVEIDRRFDCVGGHVLPVAIESTAHVKFAGSYRFQMTYRYEDVNGKPVTHPAC
jgi:hypothetical protein